MTSTNRTTPDARIAELESQLSKYDPQVAHHDVPDLVEELRILKTAEPVAETTEPDGTADLQATFPAGYAEGIRDALIETPPVPVAEAYTRCAIRIDRGMGNMAAYWLGYARQVAATEAARDGADDCDHLGTETVTRVAHGHLGDAPAGTTELLCADCGIVLPTVAADQIRKGQRFHTDHGVRQVLATTWGGEGRTTIYSTDGGFRTVSDSAALRLAE